MVRTRKGMINDWRLFFFVLVFWAAASGAARAGHFATPPSSPQSSDFLGSARISGSPAELGDEVAFFDPQGVLCGLFVVNNAGQYGIVHVYGDDQSTPAVDEGAVSGDVLSVRIWDASEGIEYGGTDIVLSTGQLGSFGPSSLPPLWLNQEGYVLNVDTRSHFGVPIPTPEVANFAGSLTILTQAASKGDEVGVYDPDGVLCGHFRVTSPGYYGIVQVYGDDPETQDIDEGASENDSLTFKVWDRSTGVERLGVLSAGTASGSFTPATVPPQFRSRTGQALNISLDYQYQAVILSPQSLEADAGTSLQLTAAYNVSDGNQKLQAITARFYFDSSRLQFSSFSDVFPSGLLQPSAQAENDSNDQDHNAETDQFVTLAWEGSDWPGSLPTPLGKLNFTVKNGAQPGVTRVNVTMSGTAAGYAGSALHTLITIINPVATVMGQVSYSGTATGIYYVGAWSSQAGSAWRSTQPLSIAAAAGGSYLLRLFPGDYIIAAYRDTDGGGNQSLADIDDSEPYGFKSQTPGAVGQSAAPQIVTVTRKATITTDLSIYDWPYFLEAAAVREIFPQTTAKPELFPQGEILGAQTRVGYRPGLGQITAMTVSGPGISSPLSLADNGILPDAVAGDGVYNRWISTGSSIEAGPYTYTLSAGGLTVTQEKTIPGAALDGLTVTAPPPLLITATPQFQWNPVAGAASYTLHLLAHTNPADSNDILLDKTGLTGASYTHAPADFVLANGATYGYYLTAFDSTGGNASHSLVKEFSVDLSKPLVSSVLFNPPLPVRPQTVALTITFSEPMDQETALEVFFGNPAVHFNGAYSSATQWSGAYTVLAQDHGIHTLTILGGRDQAGNEMTADASRQFTVDNEPPTVSSIILNPPSPVKKETVSFTIIFSEPMNQAMNPTVSFGEPVQTMNGSFVSPTNWTASVNIQTGMNGVQNLRLSNAADLAGNVMAENTGFSFTIDTLPPVPPQITAVQSPTMVNKQMISGGKEAGCAILLNGAEVVGNTPDTTWQYEVSLTGGNNHLVFMARDQARNLSGQTAVDIIYDDNPPPKVTTLTRNMNGDGTNAYLDWSGFDETGAGDIAYYRIYAHFTPFTNVAGLPVKGTVDTGHFSFTVTGLTRGNTYWFAVVAVDTRGNFDPVTTPISGTPNDIEPPEEVSNVQVHCLGESNLEISWQASRNRLGDLKEHQVIFGNDSPVTVGAGTYSFQKTGLNPAGAYPVRIKVIDQLNNISQGVSLTAATLLANPAGLTARTDDASATLTWTPINSPLLAHYAVYVKANDSFTSIAGLSPAKTAVQGTVTVTGLKNETLYHFAVAAVNISGCLQEQVTTVSATPHEDIAPPVITSVLGNNAPLTNGMRIDRRTLFSVQAMDVKSGISRVEFSLNGSLRQTDTSAPYQFDWNILADNDGVYQFRVAAFDQFDNTVSAETTLNLQAAPPAAPVITSPASGAVYHDIGATINGTAERNTVIALLLNDKMVGNAQPVGENGSFSISLTLSEGANRVEVTAQHRGGISPRSNATILNLDTVAPSPPQQFMAESLAGGEIRFTWKAAEQGEIPKGYNIYKAGTPFSDPSSRIPINSTPITALTYQKMFVGDGVFYFAVTAVDAAEIESGLSNLVAATVDGAGPEITEIVLTPQGRYLPATDTFGVGLIDVEITLSEPLLTDPFVSLSIPGAAPLAINLIKIAETRYSGSLQISETTPSGTGAIIFSGRDQVGNRGTLVSAAGKTLKIDTAGPHLLQIDLNPPEPLENSASSPLTVNVTLHLNQAVASGTVPYLTYTTKGNSSPKVISGLVPGNDTVWSGSFTLAATDGAEQGDYLNFAYEAGDDLENISTVIEGQRRFELYQGGLPPLAIPAGLKAKALPGGKVELSWSPVLGAAGYQIYRQGPQEQELTPRGSRLSATTLSDSTDTDGVYNYAVTSIRQAGSLESESAQSLPVPITTDSIPPGPPQNLSLMMLGSGVRAAWENPAGAPATSFRLFRAAGDGSGPPASLEGLTPKVSNITGNVAIDYAPTGNERYYAVAAVDEVGNLSGPSNWVYQNVNLLPVSSLEVLLEEGGVPQLAWTHPSGGAIAGYDLTLQSAEGPRTLLSKANHSSYSDSGYGADERMYEVKAVDDLNNRSKGRTAFLPVLTMSVPTNTVLTRGLINGLGVVVGNNGTNAVLVNRLELAIEGRTYSSQPFSIDPGSTTTVALVVGGHADLSDTPQAQLTLIMEPEQGTLVRIRKGVHFVVRDATLPLEIFNETLVRGATAKINFMLMNTGAEPLEILTAASYTSVSGEIRVKILDKDGNIINQAGLKQTQGEFISQATNGAYYASIPPGKAFYSGDIELHLPLSAPDEVVVQLEIDKAHYHYGWQDGSHIALTGANNAMLLQAMQTLTLVDTVYDAILTGVSPANAVTGQSITFSGKAFDRQSNDSVAGVEVKIGISLERFERFFKAFTDKTGQFTFEFKPLSYESGVYRAWAVHPDILDKPVQQQFTISRLDYAPALFRLDLLRLRQETFTVNLTNRGGTDLHNVRLLYRAADQAGGQYPAGFELVTSQAVPVLAGGQAVALSFNLTAGATAASAAELVLALVSDETPSGQWGQVRAEIKLFEPLPRLTYTPGGLESSLYPGGQEIGNLRLFNEGLVDLENINLSLAPAPGSAAVNWLILNAAASQGNLSPGARLDLSVSFTPPSDAPAGEYHYLLQVASANSTTESIHIYFRVTAPPAAGAPAPGGNLLFHVVDMYYDGQTNLGLASAKIVLQKSDDINLTFNATTSGSGHATLGPGEAEFKNVPAGRYTFKVTAGNHDEYTGSVTVRQGITAAEQVYLSKQLVQVEWEVVPVVIQDKYEIKLTATFETNVPAPVVVLEPMSVNLPDMEAGEVFTGEFRLTNHGFIRARSLKVTMPEDDEYFRYELLGAVPEYLDAKQQIVLPYRVTSLKKIGAATGVDGGGESGGGCGPSAKYICIDYTYNPCPGIPSLEVKGKLCGWYITYIPCPPSQSKPRIYVPPPPPPPATTTYTPGGGTGGGGWGGWGFGGWGGSGSGSAASPVSGFRCPPPCIPGEPCNFCCQLIHGPGMARGCGGDDEEGGDEPPIWEGNCGDSGSGGDDDSFETASTINLVSGVYQDEAQDLLLRFGKLTAMVGRSYQGRALPRPSNSSVAVMVGASYASTSSAARTVSGATVSDASEQAATERISWRFNLLDDRLANGKRSIYYAGATTITGDRPPYYDEMNRVVDSKWTILKDGASYAAAGILPADGEVPDGGIGRNYIFKNGSYTLKTTGGYFSANRADNDSFNLGSYYRFAGFIWQDLHGLWKQYDHLGRLSAYGSGDPATAARISLTWDNDQMTGVYGPDGTKLFEYVYDTDETRPNEIRWLAADGSVQTTVAYTWNGADLVKVVDVLGGEWHYSYDAQGRITSKTQPGGRKYEVSYDSYNSVTRESYFKLNESGAQTQVGQINLSYEYDRVLQEYRTTLADLRGKVTEYVFARGGGLKEKRVDGELVKQVSKDEGKRIKMIYDGQGRKKTERFTDFGAVNSVDFPDGSTMRMKYSSNYLRPIEVVNRNGAVTRMTYDANGDILSVIKAAGSEVQKTFTNEYNSEGNRVAAHLAGGVEIAKTYDAEGRVRTISGPAIANGDKVRSYTYDPFGRLDSETDPQGYTTRYHYDTAGRQTEAIKPLSANESLTTRVAYDAYGNRTQLIFPDATGLNFEYDTLDRLVGVHRLDNNDAILSVSFASEAANGLTRKTETDADGKVKSFIYDTQGRVVLENDSTGNRLTFEYRPGEDICRGSDAPSKYGGSGPLGSPGNLSGGATGGCTSARKSIPLHINRPDGVLTTLSTDFEGNVLSRMESNGNDSVTRTWTYDSLGHITRHVDARGNATRREYDLHGRLTRVINALNDSLLLGYDARDNMTSLIDEAGKTNTFTFDLGDRLSGWSNPLGKAWHYSWDLNDNLLTETDARGARRQYRYDQSNRMSGYDVLAPGNDTPRRTVIFSRNPFSQVTGYADGVTSATVSYDYLHRKTEETVSISKDGAPALLYHVIQQYNNNSTLQSFTAPDDKTYGYSYDAANRLSSLVLPDNAGVIGFARAWKNITGITLPGGVTVSRSYDSLGRLTGQVVSNDSAELLRQEFTYDAAGNLLEMAQNNGHTYSYGYDGLSQLTSAAIDAAVLNYTYDRAGNRSGMTGITGPFVYNDGQQLTAVGDDNLFYDDNGNLSREVRGGVNREYVYDERNYLIEVKENGSTLARYDYDMFGRRISKSVGGAITYYAYGDQGLLAEFDGNGQLLRGYGYQPENLWGSAPVFMRTADGSFYFYHLDHLSRPVLLTDANGKVAWRAVYEPFGKAVIAAGSSVSSNLRLPGQYYDEETGLHYNWNRYYDPDRGRYVSPDMFGPGIGASNPYTYARNNPLNMIDPFGKASLSLGQPQEVNHLDRFIPTGDDLQNLLKDGPREALREYINRFKWGVGAEVNWDNPLNPCVGLNASGYPLVEFEASFSARAYAALLLCNAMGGW